MIQEAPRRAVIYGGTENIVRELEKKLSRHGFVVEEHIPCHKGRSVRVPCRAEVLLVVQDMVPTDTITAVKAAAAQRRLPYAAITRKWAASLRILIQAGLATESARYWPTDKPIELVVSDREPVEPVIEDRAPNAIARYVAKAEAGFQTEATQALVDDEPALAQAMAERAFALSPETARELVAGWRDSTRSDAQAVKEEAHTMAAQPKTNTNTPTPPPAVPEEIKSAMRLLKEEMGKTPGVSRVFFTRSPAGEVEVQFEILQPTWGVL